MILICAISLTIGIVILTNLFGFEDFFSIEFIMQYSEQENYSSADDLGRFTAISTIKDTVFSSRTEELFGFGLGNCDFSDISIFSTPFSQKYGFLHYFWFVSPMVYIELGFVGLGLYLSFFVACFVLAYKKLKQTNSNKLFCQMGMIMAIISVVISFYNGSLKIESAYIIYFVLALPFIESKEKAT